MELYDYQQYAVDLIAKRDRPTYLGDEMGLGKSAIAINVARRLDGVSRMAVFAPAVGKLTWVREFRRWWPDMPVTVLDSRDAIRKAGRGPSNGAFIVPYSQLSLDGKYLEDLDTWAMLDPFDMSVLDEVHYLKNPAANRSKAVLKTLLPRLGFCLPMSGTPMPNHAGELYSILRAVFPDVITKRDGKMMTQWEYENYFCDITQRWIGGRQVRVIDGSKNIDVLRTRLKPHMLRRLKKDVLKSLPDMRFDVYPVSAPNAPPWRTDWSGMSEDDFLAEMSDIHVMAMRHELGLAKVRGSIEAIDDMLQGCRRKVVVFAHHQDVINKLMEGLADYNPVKIDGRVSTAQREVAITQFLDNPRCRVFVGNTLAAGTAITLVGPNCDVSDVFFVEPDFSPGNNVQAASRIHRIGQKNAVQVWFLSAADTYDDRLLEILARKSADQQQLLGAA